MNNKNIFIIGNLLVIFGFISVIILPPMFPKKGWMDMLVPNTTFSYLGFLMIVIGGAMSFYGRYKCTAAEKKERQKKQKEGKGIIISTTDTIPGKKIVKILGPVQARNNPFAITLDMAENTQRYLEKEAEKLGANAIVGMKIERQQHKKSTTYFAYGTAVIAADEK